MSTQMSEDRDVKDPEETEIVYCVELEIPTTLEALSCGIRLARSVDDKGQPNGYLADWFADKEGEGSFSPYRVLAGVLADDEESPFPTRRLAALQMAGEIAVKLAEIDPDDDSKWREDLRRFLLSVEVGAVPELDEPEGDALPSGDSPLSKEDELEDLREFKAECAGLLGYVRVAEAVVEECKSDLKVANEKLKAAQKRLNDRIDNQNGQLPLFDKQAEPTTTDPAAEEPWRDVPIAHLGLPGGIIDKLAENAEKAILTLGDMADWVADKGKAGIVNPLCAIEGIGRSSAEKIAEAEIVYIAAHPRPGEGPLEEGE